MTYEITTPSGYTFIADEEERYYIETLKAKGYEVKAIVVHSSPDLCLSCEG
jgi:hypothetical protein